MRRTVLRAHAIIRKACHDLACGHGARDRQILGEISNIEAWPRFSTDTDWD